MNNKEKDILALFNELNSMLYEVMGDCNKALSENIELKKAKKNIENDAIVPIFFGTVFTVIALIFLLRNIKNDIQTIAKIKLAPRVYIIEYVTKK